MSPKVHNRFVATALVAFFFTYPYTDSSLAAEVPSLEDGVKKKADNTACYVCHLTLKTEEMTTVHLAEGHACTECHGPSTDHMHDEMLMTTPDLLYGRRQVDAMCGECHHDPHKDKRAEVKAFVQRWRGMARPNGRNVTSKSICTDCHGTHNIDKELTADSDKKQKWESAFNGSDLAGWHASGDARWKVKLGRIVATPGTKAGGDLWTDALYEDYLMSATFRVDGPVHAGIWLRATDADAGARIEIFKDTGPPALTGSVAVPKKGPVLVNLRADSFDPGGWNTLSAEVRGPRVAVWLNGAEVGVVSCIGPAKGRIGLYIQGGPPHAGSELAVREVQIQKLLKEAATEEKTP